MQRRNDSERKLREEIVATQQSVRQVIDQKEGEVRQAQEMTQKAMAAASASTDEIRKGRQAQEFGERLASDLRTTKDQAVNALRASRQEVAALQQRELDIWSQMRDNQVTNAQREKERRDSATASSSGLDRSQPLTIQNRLVPTPSHQPPGVSVPGKERAVQPNTGLSIVAHLAPPTNKTREDDKPLDNTFREGADPKVRSKAQKQTQKAEKQKRENKEEAEQKQAKEAKKADPPPPKSSAPPPPVKKR